MRRLTVLFMILTLLLPLDARAETAPDLALLTYAAPDAGEASASPAAPTAARVVPIDLWLDGTANMGGVNGIAGSVYPSGAADSYCTGGFHYLQGNRNGGRELHGWYLDILSAIPGLLGDKQASVRVLRYGDEVYTDARLQAAGLPATPSVRRDLLTYAVAADAQVFRAMVTPSAAEGFYGAGAAGAAKLSALPTLENETLRETMNTVQQAEFADAREGVPEALVDREQGDSHLLEALACLDPSHLNILTLDTWSLGDPTVTAADQLIDPYRRLLEAQDFFGAQGLSATIFALRLDYVGSVTAYASLKPAEALHWGRIAKTDSGRYAEVAMPRCMLLLVLGRDDEVARVADRLEQFFRTDATLNDPAGRGYHSGDGNVILVNYFYGGQKYEKTRFTFAYERSDLKRAQIDTLTERDEACAVTLDGAAASPALITVHPRSDGGYDDHTVVMTAELGAAAAVLNVSADTVAQSGVLKQTGSLLLSEVAANSPDALAAFSAENGTQVIPLRDRLYVFRSGEKQAADLSVRLDGTVLTLTLTLRGADLRPGYFTFSLLSRIPDGAAETPAVFPWLADTGGDGAADAGKCDWETGESLPRAWLTLPAAIAAATGERRKTLQTGLRHAWCVGNDDTTLGLTPDIPPVFRLLNAVRLTQAFQYACTLGQRVPAEGTVTIFVDDR